MPGLRAAALTTCCLIGGLNARHCPAMPVGGSLALTRDDVFRGVSWTCGSPAAQADLHLRHAGPQSATTLYAGVWGSFGLGSSACGATRELDAYAGYSMAVSQNLSVSLSYTHYGFPGGTDLDPRIAGSRYDYDELDAVLSLRERVFLTLGWTFDALRYSYDRYDYIGRIERNRRAFSYGLEWVQPLGPWLSLSTGVGYDTVLDPTGIGYGFWSAGLSHTAGPWQLSLGYFRSSPRAVRLFGRAAAGPRVAASVVWRF